MEIVYLNDNNNNQLFKRNQIKPKEKKPFLSLTIFLGLMVLQMKKNDYNRNNYGNI